MASNATNLITAYSQYYAKANETNAHNLYENLIAYDFTDYQSFCTDVLPLYHMADTVGDHFTLESNGSSGEYRQYLFGPLPRLWLKLVEEYTRKPHGQGSIVNLVDCFPEFFDCKHCTLLPVEDGITICTKIVTNFSQPSILKILDGAFATLTDQYGELTVLGKPNRFLYLNGLPGWKELVEKYRLKLTSTGWEPFYSNSVFVNDTMVNWKTGVNFYTCESGHKHCLPIFVRTSDGYVNLLNLKDKQVRAIDDEWLVGPQKVCDCGKPAIDFVFTPHIDNTIKNSRGIIYKCDMASQLTGSYRNLQFIQEGDTIIVAFCGNMTSNDVSIIERMFDEFAIKMKIGTVNRVGLHKFPSFWNGSSVSERVSMYLPFL